MSATTKTSDKGPNAMARLAGKEQESMNGQRHGRSAGRLILVSALVAVGIATSAMPASAASASGSGRPGYWTVSRTIGTPDVTPTFSRVATGQITVERSPATTGTQYITINWRLWQLRQGRWELVTSPQRTYTVYANQYVSIPGWQVDVFPGLFATEYNLTWQNASGAVIGTAFLDFNSAGDYQCNPGFLCKIYYEAMAGQVVLSVS